MKKFLLGALLIMFTIGAGAQIKFGIKGGLNFNNIDSDISLKSSTAWHAGVLAQFKLPIIGLGIQPELLYTVSKASAQVEGGHSRDLSINYFQIPINIRWQILPIPLVKPIVLAGPYFSYATNFSGGFNKDTVKKFDWGLGLGLGVEVWKFQLAGKYSWGLQNITKGEGSMKNRAFTLSLAYLF